MLALILIVVFLAMVASTWWSGLWSNVISLCNFVIAALAAYGLRETVNDLFDYADPNVAQFADLLSVWGVFVLVTAVLRSATDTLSSIRLRFPPALELVGQIFICGILAACFVLFAASTIQYIDFRTYEQRATRADVNFLVTGYESMGLNVWSKVAGYWESGPFSN